MMTPKITKPEEEAESTFSLRLERSEGYRFDVDFDLDGIPSLTVDEAPPVGDGAGPTPARMLGTAVGHCLASSLLFCLRKARIEASSMKVDVKGGIARNAEGRLRINQIHVRLEPAIAANDVPRARRCFEVFEDYCTVTASVRQGIDVRVDVDPRPT